MLIDIGKNVLCLIETRDYYGNPDGSLKEKLDLGKK